MLNAAEPPPLAVDDRVEVDESLRLRYRYVDLRRPRMQANLRLRSTVNRALRAAMDRQGFVEVETPLLWSPTPEGAREFTVPSRLSPGSCYVLPQSPQLAKQLLMVAGVDRYYQIARCLRDEDLRADRQFEFSQLDLEASFVSQEDVLGFVSVAVLDAAEAVTGERPVDIPTITWSDAIDRYGTDKPDLRFGMELIDLSAVFERHRGQGLRRPVRQGHRVRGRRRPEPLPVGRPDRPRPPARRQGLGLVPGGHRRGRGRRRSGRSTLDSPLDRFLSDDRTLRAADRHRGGGRRPDPGGGRPVPAGLLGPRASSGSSSEVVRSAKGPYRYLWVVDFPMFDGEDEDGHPGGRPPSVHHAPPRRPRPPGVRPGVGAGPGLRPGAQRMGVGLGQRPDPPRRHPEPGVRGAGHRRRGGGQSRFGFLLGAFRYGAPPHAGFAVGIDRLVAIFAGEDSIREVIAFPKTQSGSDPMTGAPKPLAPRVLADLGLQPTPAKD